MLSILLVEDDKGVAKSLVSLILAAQRAYQSPEVARSCEIKFHRVATMKEWCEHLHDPVDIILLDLKLPDSEPRQTLDFLDVHAERIAPVIIITAMETATDEDAWMLPSIASGAKSFFSKRRLEDREGPRQLLNAILCVFGAAQRQLRRRKDAPEI